VRYFDLRISLPRKRFDEAPAVVHPGVGAIQAPVPRGVPLSAAQDDIKVQMTADEARNLLQPVVIDVVRHETGELVETVTLLRYAGHYRTDSVHAFAIKDAEGKFRVRGEVALGLVPESPFRAYLATSAPVFAA
jgi:hypothetical protein